jgi:hypothetical protein
MPVLRTHRCWKHGAAAIGGLLATCCFSLRADAFCRAVSVGAPAGYDPVSSGCWNGHGAAAFDLYWSGYCVGYSLQKDASRQVSLDQATHIAAQAFSAWTQLSCGDAGGISIMPVDEGPVDCAQVQYNKTQPNQHVIIFRDQGWPYADSANAIGLTTLTVDLTTGEIFDADMEINSADFALSVDGDGGAPSVDDAGRMTYDLLSVMTHEAGHFLGLAHSTSTSALMYAHYHPGTTAPTLDDQEGICSIYLPGGMRSTSSGMPVQAPLDADGGLLCDPTPRHGFSSECALDSGASPPPTGTDGGAEVPDAEAGTSDADIGVSTGGSTGSRGGSQGAGGGCSVGALHPASGGLSCAGLSALGAAVIASRRRRGRDASWGNGARRVRASALAITLCAAGLNLPAARDAHASVSVAILFDELVRDASAVAVVTAEEQRAGWENDRILTYTRVRVHHRIAGQLPETVWVRTLGGAVGTIGQIVEGEPSLPVGSTSLLFLRPAVDPDAQATLGAFSVVGRAQGQFPVVAEIGRPPRIVGASDMGALVPPAPERVARVAHLHPSPAAARLAREVLPQRTLDDAAREVAAVWPRLHAT